MWPFDLQIYILPWLILKVKVMHISTENISKVLTNRANIILQSNTNSHMGFQLAYLDLTSAHSKGLVKVKYISSVNIENIVTLGNHYYCHQIGS